jgi:DnaK suppressor protein
MATATVQATRARQLHTEELTGEQLTQLRQQLLQERAGVVQRVQERLGLAAPLPTQHADEMDDASANQDLALLFRLADKEQKLLNEIDAALARLDDGSYGFCEGTGESIEYRRLQARPWARYSVAYKEALEREQARPGR